METNDGHRYEEEGVEQPVDYSKKYIERNRLPKNGSNENSTGNDRSPCSKEFREHDNEVDLYGDYAETDLDQPTDYSLRYAEDDTDEDEKQRPEYFSGSVQEDTVKTYCTEGTPYETPFNFSTATSMSDLRVEETKETIEPPKRLQTKKPSDGQKETVAFRRRTHVPLNSDEARPLIGKTSEARVNSGAHVPVRLTPEKMVDYYETRMPDGFSRTNSLSSLGGAITVQQNNPPSPVTSKVPSLDSRSKVSELDRNLHTSTTPADSDGLRLPSETSSPVEGKSNGRVVDKEGKMVTFGGQDYYAEQTPLMFSRCSSLGSLSGFEQHSIHDDRSSVVSDFSRRTSGIVSPSELPDSPTQTVPPSPHNHKNQCADFITKIQEEAVRPSVRHLSYSKLAAVPNSVFEDDIATFKEESTPIEFSTATSLSSLTIDDELKVVDSSKPPVEPEASLRDLKESIRKDAIKEKGNKVEVEKDQEQVSDGDEDDEDMLAACITMGMQNNRYRQSFKSSNVQKPGQTESSNMTARYPRSSVSNRLERRSTENVPSGKSNKTTMEIVPASDTVHVYCTEDTPAEISPVGSQSNLSALSMPSVQEDIERIEERKSSSEVECHRNDLSDESSNLSGEDEKILDECIQSGMPKVRQITPPPPNNGISFVQKSEALTQRFDICGTPSSSPVESGHGTKNSILAKSLCHAPVEQENEISDDSPNHSDDEAILSECIRSAMPKVRGKISQITDLVVTKSMEKSKVVALRKSSHSFSPSYFQSECTQQNKCVQTKKSVPFEDNLSLSEEEEDVILAQCIRSGMPKALNVSSALPISVTKKADQCSKVKNIPAALPFYMTNKPQSSTSRSTMVQTIRSRTANKIADTEASLTPHKEPSSKFDYFSTKTSDNFERSSTTHCVNNSTIKSSVLNSCSRRSLLSENDHGNVSGNILNGSRTQTASSSRSPISNGTDNEDDESCRGVTKLNVAPSRHSSVSSLSEEGSLGSIEEWALLELCISSGMPRNKYRLKGIKATDTTISSNHDDHESVAEDNYSMCSSYNSYVCKT